MKTDRKTIKEAGDSRYIILLQTFFDIVLDFVFVFGVESLQIPALGVEGAAWSTVVAIWTLGSLPKRPFCSVSSTFSADFQPFSTIFNAFEAGHARLLVAGS